MQFKRWLSPQRAPRAQLNSGKAQASQAQIVCPVTPTTIKMETLKTDAVIADPS